MWSTARSAVALAVLLVSGCGVSDDEGQARIAARDFYASVQAREGAGACERLAPPTAESLERQEARRCEEAVLTLDLGDGPPRRVQLFQTEAVVTLGGGEKAYLDRRAGGWKVTAAGCASTGAGPADCELGD